MLNLLARLFGYRRYLEVGLVDGGSNFAAVRAEDKVGVGPPDAAAASGGRSGRVVGGTSSDFFGALGMEETFDLIFVDGHQSASQVRLTVVAPSCCKRRWTADAELA